MILRRIVNTMKMPVKYLIVLETLCIIVNVKYLNENEKRRVTRTAHAHIMSFFSEKIAIQSPSNQTLEPFWTLFAYLDAWTTTENSSLHPRAAYFPYLSHLSSS